MYVYYTRVLQALPHKRVSLFDVIYSQLYKIISTNKYYTQKKEQNI